MIIPRQITTVPITNKVLNYLLDLAAERERKVEHRLQEQKRIMLTHLEKIEKKSKIRRIKKK